MAAIFPDLETIGTLKVKPTPGELHLLLFLADVLDDNYEIYFQPLLNGDNPDIIVMRRKAGIWIIEVKDWNLRYYRSYKKGSGAWSTITVIKYLRWNRFWNTRTTSLSFMLRD